MPGWGLSGRSGMAEKTGAVRTKRQKERKRKREREIGGGGEGRRGGGGGVNRSNLSLLLVNSCHGPRTTGASCGRGCSPGRN